MPTEKKRIAVTVHDPRPLRVLGLDPGQVGGTELWAIIERHAMLVEQAGRAIESQITPQEWGYLADVMNGCLDLWNLSGSRIPATAMLVANIEDAHALDGTGAKWFDDDPDRCVTLLSLKISNMTPVEADAVCAALRAFWSDPNATMDDQWWSVARRTFRDPGKPSSPFPESPEREIE